MSQMIVKTRGKLCAGSCRAIHESWRHLSRTGSRRSLCGLVRLTENELRVLLARNDRTPSGEIRPAIRYYLTNFNTVLDRALGRTAKELR